MSDLRLDITLTVNGEPVSERVERARRWSISCARSWG